MRAGPGARWAQRVSRLGFDSSLPVIDRRKLESNTVRDEQLDLASAGCAAADRFPGEILQVLRQSGGIGDVSLEIQKR
jgi:hypothetical protein